MNDTNYPTPPPKWFAKLINDICNSIGRLLFIINRMKKYHLTVVAALFAFSIWVIFANH